MTDALEIEYERPPLTDYQRRAFFTSKRYSFIEAMTKSGKTVAAMDWLLEMSLTLDPINYYWVAPVYPQSFIVYERFKRGLPPELRDPVQNPPRIILPNQHVIWFKSADEPDNLYGDDVGAAVIDEASRVKEDAFTAVRSTLTATGGPLRCIGNVKGRKNWFYRMARKAEAGDPDFHFDRITADDAIRAGIISREEIEDARKVLTEAAFKELYYCEPSDDAGNPFGMDKIARCIAPKSDRAPVVFGVDLAKSVDWTVVIGLDALGHVCRFERWQGPWKETIERVKSIVGHTKTLMDATGVGDPVVEQIQRETNTFIPNPRPDQIPMIEGVKFTSASKQMMMEGLAVAIQREQIHFPHGPIRLEMESFEYQYRGNAGSFTGVRYEAMEGCHDDCVCALALAWRGFTGGSLRAVAALSGSTGGSYGQPEWKGQIRK